MSGCGHFDFRAGSPALDKIGLGVPAAVYQRLGYAVLPLARGLKKPHRMLPWSSGSADGVHHATLEGRAVTGWWSLDPAANIGVATGSRSRLAVIDLDVKGADNGIDHFWRFLTQHGLQLPDCPWVRTPSGGRHLWLRTPAGLAVPERPGILPSVDVKGDGGLVVAPPSMQLVTHQRRPGEHGSAQVPVPYEWHGCPCEAPPAPDWLPHWLAYAPPGGAAASEAPGAAVDIGELSRTGIPHGQRNATAYRIMCQRLRVHDGDIAKARADLALVLAATDLTGFGEGEIGVICHSAASWYQGVRDAERRNMQAWAPWLNKVRYGN